MTFFQRLNLAWQILWAKNTRSKSTPNAFGMNDLRVIEFSMNPCAVFLAAGHIYMIDDKGIRKLDTEHQIT